MTQEEGPEKGPFHVVSRLHPSELSSLPRKRPRTPEIGQSRPPMYSNEYP